MAHFLPSSNRSQRTKASNYKYGVNTEWRNGAGTFFFFESSRVELLQPLNYTILDRSISFLYSYSTQFSLPSSSASSRDFGPTMSW